MITARSETDGSTITRNVSHYKPLSNEAQTPIIVKDLDIDNQPQAEPNHINQQPIRKQYPKRDRRPLHLWRKY